MAIAQVNSTASFAAASVTSISATATSLTAGNLIVVVARIGSADVWVSSITDTAGNVYNLAAMERGYASVTRMEMWYCQNALGNASNVVTANFSGSTSNNAIATVQYSGIALTNALDVSSSISTTSATVAVRAMTSTVANAVIVMAAEIDATATTWTAGSGFTTVVQDASHVVHLEDQIVSTIQSAITPTTTSSNSGTAKAGIAAFFHEPVSGGGGGGGLFGASPVYQSSGTNQPEVVVSGLAPGR